MASMTINIHGTDGSFWPVHGEDAGTEGVDLGVDQVKGLFDSPVRTSWVAANAESGGTMKGMWNDWRDLALGFHVSADRVAGGDQEDIDSRFRQAFDYRVDQWDHDAKLACIEVITENSTRFLDVQLYEQPDFDPGIDRSSWSIRIRSFRFGRVNRTTTRMTTSRSGRPAVHRGQARSRSGIRRISDAAQVDRHSW